MSKVYLVADGDYSDYRILGVFSSLELANQAKARLCADNPIDERELDEVPPAPEHDIMWSIMFDKSGNVTEWKTIADKRLVESGWRRAAKEWHRGQIEVLARGDSLDDAIKSATDTRRMWLALPANPGKPSVFGYYEVK